MLRVIATTRFINGNIKQLTSQPRLFSLSASYISGKDDDFTNELSEANGEKHKTEVTDSAIDPDVSKISTKSKNEVPSPQKVVVIDSKPVLVKGSVVDDLLSLDVEKVKTLIDNKKAELATEKEKIRISKMKKSNIKTVIEPEITLSAADNEIMEDTLEVISDEVVNKDKLSAKEKPVKLVVPTPKEAANRPALNLLKGLTLKMKEHENTSQKDAATNKIVEETLKVISDEVVDEDKLSAEEKTVKPVVSKPDKAANRSALNMLKGFTLEIKEHGKTSQRDAANNETVEETLKEISDEVVNEDKLSAKEKTVKPVVSKPDEAANRSALSMLKGLTVKMKGHEKTSQKDAANNEIVEETLKVISDEAFTEDMFSSKEKTVKPVVPKPDEAANRSALNKLKGFTLEMKEHEKTSQKDAANNEIVEETLKVISDEAFTEDMFSSKEKTVKPVVPKPDEAANRSALNMLKGFTFEMKEHEKTSQTDAANNERKEQGKKTKPRKRSSKKVAEKFWSEIIENSKSEEVIAHEAVKEDNLPIKEDKVPTPDKAAKRSALNMLKDLAAESADSKYTNNDEAIPEQGDELTGALKEVVAKETVSRDLLRAFLKKSVVRSNFDMRVKNNRRGSNLFDDFDISTWADHEKRVTLHEMEYENVLGNLGGSGLPRNEFEVQMLDMDKEWRYPIDNEQDLGIEETTSFEEHVFLDHYLEEFPDIEPIQKYMELVITGLQQNPYISVQEKTDKIMWHKDYFDKFSPDDLSMSMNM